MWNTNIVTAIDRCMEMVGDQKKIVLDVIISDAIYDQYENKTSKNAMENYFREQSF